MHNAIDVIVTTAKQFFTNVCRENDANETVFDINGASIEKQTT